MKYEKSMKNHILYKNQRLTSDLSKLEKITLSPTAQKYTSNNKQYNIANDGCHCPECSCVVEAFSPAGVAGGGRWSTPSLRTIKINLR